MPPIIKEKEGPLAELRLPNTDMVTLRTECDESSTIMRHWATDKWLSSSLVRGYRDSIGEGTLE